MSTSTPSLNSEYFSTTPLQVRIDTHARYSEHPDDPAAAVLEVLDLAGTESLADIGCGDARFLAHLAERGHSGRLVNVDNSAAMVAAATAIPGVDGVLGEATALPLADREFDRTTARHMLYHVPDPVAALREFRRITRPGGRVVVTVNHARTCTRTGELVVSHAQAYGLEPVAELANSVNSDTLPEMMAEVFTTVSIARFDNALVFDTAPPLIRLAHAMASFCGVGTDSPHRDAILADVATDIHRWFASNPGQVWRDPKGYIVATGIVE
ncbi:class I SAM-dependent methyltransferase [Nocardia sp. NBC_01009]|uniref:class I SAM-dependent methyltransferase n=1 Tax=Nocardia sp. NBC_01009 TaxID=2975996 RepID=UPI0038646D93|nr:class I SAM-dependent methyltransferase [Nocardia sp. NBC_01009]